MSKPNPGSGGGVGAGTPKRLPRHDHNDDQIYFAYCGGLVKIGLSRNIRRRMDALKTASPMPVQLLLCIPGSWNAEGKLHQQFAASRSHGEWFHLTPDLRKYLVEQAGHPGLMEVLLRNIGAGDG